MASGLILAMPTSSAQLSNRNTKCLSRLFFNHVNVWCVFVKTCLSIILHVSRVPVQFWFSFFWRHLPRACARASLTRTFSHMVYAQMDCLTSEPVCAAVVFVVRQWIVWQRNWTHNSSSLESICQTQIGIKLMASGLILAMPTSSAQFSSRITKCLPRLFSQHLNV